MIKINQSLEISGAQSGTRKGFYSNIRFSPVSRIGHILRRNCLVQQVIEGTMKGVDRSDRKTRKKT